MTTESDMGAHPAGEDAHSERGHIDRDRDNFDRSSPLLQEPAITVLEGWSIFPCHSAINGSCTCGRVDCTARGKHPKTLHGVKDASDDPTQWQRWSTWGELNWALACGRKSNVFVVDIDPAKGGFDSWDEYEMNQRGEPFPDTLRSRTGGGGVHIFLSYPPSVEVRNRVAWMPGVDIRSDGGYVILPPGRHVSGGRYEWVNWGTPISSAPIDLVRSVSVGRGRSGSGGVGIGDDMPRLAWFLEHGFGRPGERDSNSHRLACHLWRRYWGRPDLVEAIMGEVWMVTDQGDHPFTWPTAAAKIGPAREFVASEIEREQESASQLFGGVS